MLCQVQILTCLFLIATFSLLLYQIQRHVKRQERIVSARRIDLSETNVIGKKRLNQTDVPEKTTGSHHEENLKKYTRETPSKQMLISCWIMTSPKDLKKRARYIKQTWSERCDRLLFISSETNERFPTVGIDAEEGREHVSEKTLRGYHYVALHHMQDCDWFLKADDDTYVIMENLRHFLKDKDPNEAVYYGHHFKTYVEQEYSSGSSLVVSKEAMRRFAEKGLDPKTCRQTTGEFGDVAFCQCMETLGVKLGNSTDSQGRSRFHALEPGRHFKGLYPLW